ncbi:MAG: aminotransferase class IV, partial [Gammaproteobacteria bacterium]
MPPVTPSTGRGAATIRSPEYMWLNGTVVRWADASLHVWSEVATRGASVFEGIRAYWHEASGSYYALSYPEHLRRLYQSAKLLRFPTSVGAAELTAGAAELLSKLDYREHAYVRPTLFLDDSHGQGAGAVDASAGAYIVCFRMPRPADRGGIRCGVSSWRRPGDLTLSPRIKSGAGFLGLRLPRIEAAERGFDDMIMLNERGTVAEATGANVFIVRDGVAITPPVTVGLLEGVTRARLLRMLPGTLGVSAVEREIGRSELYAADEVFICSTMHEILPVLE